MASPGEIGGIRRLAKQVDAVACPASDRGIGDAVPEVERPLRLAVGVAVGVDDVAAREACTDADQRLGAFPAADQWRASSAGVPRRAAAGDPGRIR